MDLLPLSCFRHIWHLFLADQEQCFPGACLQGSGTILKGLLNLLWIRGWLNAINKAVAGIVYLTYGWPFLQKMGFTAGQMDWIGRARTFLIHRGEWSRLAPKPSEFKEEWGVMPPLEALTGGTVQPTSPLQMGVWLWQFAPCHPGGPWTLSLSNISKHTSHTTKCRDPIPPFCVHVCPFGLLSYVTGDAYVVFHMPRCASKMWQG